MAYPRGLVLHGSTYRIQKRVPKDCLPHYNKPILYHRTECSDKRAAASVAWKWLAEIEADFDRIRSTGSLIKTSISDEEADRLCQLMLVSRLAADEEGRALGDLADDSMYDRHLANAAENEAAARDALARGKLDGLKWMAVDWLTNYGYELGLESEAFKQFVFRFAKRYSEANKAVRARDEGEVVETPTVPEPPKATKKPKQKQAPQSPEQTLMLSYLIQRFMDNRDQTIPMFKKYQSVLPLMLALIGDKPVSELTQLDLEEFFKDICKLPPRWSDQVKRSGVSVRQLLELDHETCMSPKTFQDTYVAAVRPFINESKRLYGDPLYGDYKFPYHLTTEGIRYRGSRKEGERKQRAFKVDELKRLFEGTEYARFAKSSDDAPRYWLPLIGLFTGARVNEICQLNPQVDIITDDAIPFFEFTPESEGDERITKTIKNQTSVRRVPIHPRLIDLGILDYVKAQKGAGHRLLFPGWPPSRGKASAKAEKWFREFMMDTGLRDETPGKTLLGMHAFRHTLLNRALNLGVVNAEVITGHARDVSAIVRGYEGEMELANKLKVLSQIDFDVAPPKCSTTKI